MFAKYMTTTLLGSALMATAAFAQAPTTPSTTTTSPPAATSTAPDTSATTTTTSSSPSTTASSSDSSFTGDWRTSKLVGLKVYNDNNESVGSISELLAGKDGKIAAVVIGVGGILGVGEHDVAVPFEKIKWVTEPVAYTGAGGSAMTKSSPGAGTTTTGSATNTAPATASKLNPWYPDHAVYNASKDELKGMPEFKYAQ